MPSETKTSARLEPTRTATAETSKGNIRVERKTATTSKQTVPMPAEFRFALLRNDGGTNKILINFDSDGATDFWTLEPGASLPTAIEVKEGTVLNYQSNTGTSPLEILIWG